MNIDKLWQEANDIENPKEGQLLVSDFMVCQSAAGYYIGQWCLEYDNEMDWFPQPYYRATDYLYKEEADNMMKHWEL